MSRSSRFIRRSRAFPQGLVFHHHKDFGEESIDGRTELGRLDKCAAQIFPRFQHAVNDRRALLQLLQQRDLRRLLQQRLERRIVLFRPRSASGSSRAMFFTRLNATASF